MAHQIVVEFVDANIIYRQNDLYRFPVFNDTLLMNVPFYYPLVI